MAVKRGHFTPVEMAVNKGQFTPVEMAVKKGQFTPQKQSDEEDRARVARRVLFRINRQLFFFLNSSSGKQNDWNRNKLLLYVNQLLDFMKKQQLYILNIQGKQCDGSESDGKNDLYSHAQ
jgi:hypothetical protein